MTTVLDTAAMLAALEQAYANAATPREEADALLQLCRMHDRGNHKQMLECAIKALTAARKGRYRKGIAGALKYEGRARYLLGEYEPATARLNTACDLYKALRDRSGVIDILCLLSTLHSYNTAPDKARQVLLQAEEYLPEVPNRDTIRLYGAWSGFYRTIGDPEKVMEYSGNMLALSEKLDYENGIAEACHNLGFIALGFNDKKTGLNYFDRALEISRRTGNVPMELQILQELGWWYLHVGELDRALEIGLSYRQRAEEMKADIARVYAEILVCDAYRMLQDYGRGLHHAKAMTRMARRYSSPAAILMACTVRGDLHSDRNEADDAILWYKRGLTLAQQGKAVPHVMEFNQRLAQVYERKGDLQTAYRHYRDYMEMHENLLGFMKQKAVASASVAIQMEQGEREREQLQAQMERLERAIEQKQQELAASALLVAERDEVLSELQTELRDLLAMPAEQSRQAISSLVSKLGRSFDPPQAWEEFNRQFQLADPDFIKTLTERYSGLTPTELKVCSLLRVNLSTKDIASLIGVQPASVDIYRSAIRKKMGLPRGANLTAVLAAL